MAKTEDGIDEKKMDKKVLKKAETDRKKEEKRLRSKAGEAKEEMEEPKGGKAVIFFVTLIIIVIWLAIFALLIKLDVGGFGSSVLHPLLKDVPFVNKVLPEVTTTAEEKKYPYSSVEEAVKQIKDLEKEIGRLQNKKQENSDYESDLEKEVARLKVFEQAQKDFEKTQKDFYDEVVFSDKAPDIKEYIKFYESLDPANAERIYKQVLQQEETDKKITSYAETYSSMKPKQAAAIMEQMTDDLKLVAQILENMDTESRASILGAMKSDVAASVTKLMKP